MSRANAMGTVVNIQNSGAKANDGKDGSLAVRKAINQCRKQPGAIGVFADTKRGRAAAGVHRDLVIEGNTIRNTDGAGIYVCSADGVVIRNNVIENCSRAPTKKQRAAAIYLVNSRNVTITGNSVPEDSRSETMAAALTIGGGCERKTITVRDNRGF